MVHQAGRNINNIPMIGACNLDHAQDKPIGFTPQFITDSFIKSFYNLPFLLIYFKQHYKVINHVWKQGGT